MPRGDSAVKKQEKEISKKEDKESIWSMASQMNNNNTNSSGSVSDKSAIEHKLRVRYLLLLGSEGVGKTTLINRFLDRRDDLHKAKTLALDFTFGRRTGKSLRKDIAHIWELGNGTKLLTVSEALLAFSAELYGLNNLTIILMLDLSKPTRLWNTIEKSLDYLFQAIRRQRSSTHPDLLQNLEKKSWTRIDAPKTEDEKNFEPFPIPLVILGGKYDVFQEFDSERKHSICLLLRCISHTLGATLQFYSSKDVTLIKRAKELLSHHGLGLRIGWNISQDHNKPIVIPAGTDSFRSMKMKFEMPSKTGEFLYHRWKITFLKEIPQDLEEPYVIPNDPTQDPIFKEPAIDSMRSLHKYLK